MAAKRDPANASTIMCRGSPTDSACAAARYFATAAAFPGNTGNHVEDAEPAAVSKMVVDKID